MSPQHTRRPGKLTKSQLGLAHGALQPQQEPVVEVPNVVNAFGVAEQRPEHGADLEQLMPVATGARQARHLDAENDADVVQSDLRNQALEAGPAFDRLPLTAEIVIDHNHLVGGPAELDGTLDQAILEPGRLLITLDLLRCRLTHVDDGEAFQMGRCSATIWMRSERQSGVLGQFW